MTGHPIFHVDADADTGEWMTARNGYRVDTLVDTGERAGLIDWLKNRDTDEFHYDTFERTPADWEDTEGDTETCLVRVRFVRS
jgi:hypothetical protein